VAVLLVHAHGYSHAEVAELTGMTPDAVRSHVHRGLKRLRATLEVT
jgi:DNA-directed RNA polymerase specialized sigma24 family protein